MLNDGNRGLNEKTEHIGTAFITNDIIPSLTVLVPTKNESGNIELLLTRISRAMEDIPTEVLFVDDSSDDTPEVIRAVADQFPSLMVHLIHRAPDQRFGGLGGAVVTGMGSAKAPYVCVMDGDLQHPPELLPQMLETAITKHVDLVVASRRASDSDASGLGLVRTWISRSLDLVARIMFPRELRGVGDPLTGYFLVRLDALDLEILHPQGFKILLEILVRHPSLRKAELAFHFASRHAGKSKASTAEAYKYLNLLFRMRFGEKSVHFLEFAVVGASGILVNSAVLAFATEVLKIFYLYSVVLGTIASTTWNFFLTEYWVFESGGRSRGRVRRYLLFFVMNNIALLFRGPIIYLLTSVLGMHYLLSNLISLGALTILRYFVADSWIWGRAKLVIKQTQSVK